MDGLLIITYNNNKRSTTHLGDAHALESDKTAECTAANVGKAREMQCRGNVLQGKPVLDWRTGRADGVIPLTHEGSNQTNAPKK